MRNKKRPVLHLRQWKLEINQFHPINQIIQLKINRSSIIYTIAFFVFQFVLEVIIEKKRTVTVSNGIQRFQS